MGAQHHKTAVNTVYLSMASNAALAAIKWVTGYLGNSYALIADAIESISDIFSSMLVLFGLKYASRPADKNHPYGHGRVEPLITFLVVGILIASAVLIAYESIRNIRTPHEAPRPYTLLVLGGIILWKEISYRVVLKKGKETNSSSLQADAWHHRSDAASSAAAFAGISIALIFGKGYESADDWAALFASAFILYNCYRIFRPALGEIMDEQLYPDLEISIRKISREVKGVLDTEKCYIRKTGASYIVDLHVVVDGNISVKEGHAIAHRLKDTLQLKITGIADILIHVEPDGNMA
jgi:cation diffusion facilitator family transporter